MRRPGAHHRAGVGARFDEVEHRWSQDERDLAAEAIYRFVFRSLYRFSVQRRPAPGQLPLPPGRPGDVPGLRPGEALQPRRGRHPRRHGRVDRAPRPACLPAGDRRAGFLPIDAPFTTTRSRTTSGTSTSSCARPTSPITPAWSSESVRRFFDASGPHGEIVKAANVPASFVIIQRINLGLFAVLGELNATAQLAAHRRGDLAVRRCAAEHAARRAGGGVGGGRPRCGYLTRTTRRTSLADSSDSGEPASGPRGCRPGRRCRAAQCARRHARPSRRPTCRGRPRGGSTHDRASRRCTPGRGCRLASGQVGRNRAMARAVRPLRVQQTMAELLEVDGHLQAALVTAPVIASPSGRHPLAAACRAGRPTPGSRRWPRPSRRCAPWWHSEARVVTDGRLAREHHGVGAVEDGVGDSLASARVGAGCAPSTRASGSR